MPPPRVEWKPRPEVRRIHPGRSKAPEVDEDGWRCVTRKKKRHIWSRIELKPSCQAGKVPVDLLGVCFNCFKDDHIARFCPNHSYYFKCQRTRPPGAGLPPTESNASRSSWSSPLQGSSPGASHEITVDAATSSVTLLLPRCAGSFAGAATFKACSPGPQIAHLGVPPARLRLNSSPPSSVICLVSRLW
jgi:hypothetical protein